MNQNQKVIHGFEENAYPRLVGFPFTLKNQRFESPNQSEPPIHIQKICPVKSIPTLKPQKLKSKWKLAPNRRTRRLYLVGMDFRGNNQIKKGFPVSFEGCHRFALLFASQVQVDLLKCPVNFRGNQNNSYGLFVDQGKH